MGGCPVSACTRRLATCSAHAANQSLSWSSDSMPWCIASARNAADIPVRSFLLPPPLRRVRLTVDQADAQDRARPRQPRIRERGAVIGIQDVRYAPSGDGAAEQLLAGPGVLPVIEPAVGQQPGVVIDDQEQPGPRRPVPFRVRHRLADQHIGDPPLVRPLRLVAAVRFRGGFERGPVQPGAAQLPADGPVRDPHAVPVIQDRGDLRRRAAGSSSRSAAASANSSGIARTFPVSERAAGRSPSTPPAREARSHRSTVPREYRRTVPSGCACWRAAIARTTAPRSPPDSRGFAASAITAHRCSAISCRIF